MRQRAGLETNGMLLAANVAALATLVPVTAYQLGLLARLPDPPGDVFASERITSSKAAHPFGVPDGTLGLASYATTLTLILLSRRNPRINKLLALKLAGDASMAGFNVVRQVTSFGKICSWCTGTALCTAAMVFAGRKLLRQSAEEAADQVEQMRHRA